MALQAQSKGSSDFEKTIFEPGMYTMRLARMFVMLGNPSKFHPEGQAKIGMIWEYEQDGEKHELADFVGLPKNLKWNEKGAYWKRLAGITGMPVTDDNVGGFMHHFEPDVDFFDQIAEYISELDDKGKKQKLEISSLTWNGAEVLGKSAQLVLSHYIRDNGEVGGNNVETIMPVQAAGAGGVRKTGSKSTAPVQQRELVTAGPAAGKRNPTTESDEDF